MSMMMISKRLLITSKRIVLTTRQNNYAFQQMSTVPNRVSIEQAKAMPKNYDELSNDILLTMAVMGDQEAREERVIREIMSVDNLSWEKAEVKFYELAMFNRKGSICSSTTACYPACLYDPDGWMNGWILSWLQVFSSPPCLIRSRSHPLYLWAFCRSL